MREKLNVKVGDKLLYQYWNFRERYEKIVTVIRVTPTGRIRIDYCDSQFDKYGVKMGDGYSFPCLSIPTEEDYKRIEENSIISKALFLMGEKNKKNLSYEQAIKIIEILKETDCDD